MRLTLAYSPAPICIPSRATIMTGLEGHSHGLKLYLITETRSAIKMNNFLSVWPQIGETIYL